MVKRMKVKNGSDVIEIVAYATPSTVDEAIKKVHKGAADYLDTITDKNVYFQEIGLIFEKVSGSNPLKIAVKYRFKLTKEGEK